MYQKQTPAICYRLGTMFLAALALFATATDLAAQTHRLTPAEVTELSKAPGARVINFADLDHDRIAQRGAERGVSLVYSNTVSATLYTTGALGAVVADDLQTATPCGCDVTSFSIRVDGNGGGTFIAVTRLYDGCPGNGGQLIPGTETFFSGIPDTGPVDLVVDLSAAPIFVGNNIWIEAAFNNATAGILMGAPPELGFSEDFYYNPFTSCATAFPGTDYASFAAQVFCSGTGSAVPAVNPAPADAATGIAIDTLLTWNNVARSAAGVPSVDPPNRPVTSTPPETAVMGITHEEYIDRERALHASLIGDVPANSRAGGILVHLTPDDLAILEGRVPSTPGRLQIGINKAVTPSVGLDRGAMTVQNDGSFTWAISVTSLGASALRVHLTNVSLPDGAELFFLNDEGEAHGPYTGTGPSGTGDFWTHSVMSETGILLLRHPGPAVDNSPFEIVEVAHMDRLFNAVMGQRGGSFCGNDTCIEDASCAGGAPVADARLAVAQMVFQVPGQGTFVCSGGLIADTDPGSQHVYFLTANHCISEQVVAQSLEAYFFYTSSSCGAACPSPSASFRTLGASVIATGTAGDYSLLELSQNPPAGAVFLGWNNNPVATSNGTPLYRISHPGGGAQTYSDQAVDSSPPVVCNGLPVGQFIYSADVFGGTAGGSSGSPVVNASGEVVGQLFGCCGTNCTNVCDAAANRTIDGAIASYWDAVSDFLNPICTPRYDVFFGTTNPPTSRICTQTELTNCDPGVLGCNVTYYWQVDTNYLGTTALSPVWSFTTFGGTDCNNNGVGDQCEVADGSAPDCNANGIPDECDIGTVSLDCDANGIPDECGIASGAPDCNANGVPDVCDIGTVSTDCNTNNIPDECEADCNANGTPDDCDIDTGASLDCQTNGVPDECDIATGTSSDNNANGVPDECEATPPAIAAAPHSTEKNRYIAFNPNNGASPVAFSVLLPDGRTGWVGEPVIKTHAGTDAQWVAWVVDSANGGADQVRDWSGYVDAATGENVVLVTGCVIAPNESYEIRTANGQGFFTTPLTVTTVPQPTLSGSWADCVGVFDSGAGKWTGPNSATGFNDISAIIDGFQASGTAPISWVDLDGQFPNYIINFVDIDMSIKGFQSIPYPVAGWPAQTIADCPLGAAP